MSPLPRFTAQVESYLRQAGWHEGREVPVDDYAVFLRGAGYDVHPEAIGFLREFGGLRIRFPHWGGPQRINDLDLNPYEAEGHDNEDAAKYQDLVPEALCFIGVADLNQHDILMSSAGAVYLGRDEDICWIGESGDEAIERYCTNQMPRKLT